MEIKIENNERKLRKSDLPVVANKSNCNIIPLSVAKTSSYLTDFQSKIGSFVHFL